MATSCDEGRLIVFFNMGNHRARITFCQLRMAGKTVVMGIRYTANIEPW